MNSQDSRIDITIALEANEDWPVADVCFAGEHWASITFDGDTLGVHIYGHSGPGAIPVDAVIGSLEMAKQRLVEALGRDETA